METTQYDLAALSAVLSLWGKCTESMRNWSGYGTSDLVYKATYGCGGNRDRLPIPDMPSIVVRMTVKINSLPDDLANAVTLRYAYNMSPSGWWSEEEKAEALGLSVQQYRYRVRKAKGVLLSRLDMAQFG